ncbi:MAG: AraC family transcriptional regulator [Bacteroidota bacterium]
MKTRIIHSDLEEMLIEIGYPNGLYSPGPGIMERSFCKEIPIGTGHYKELFFDGIHIGYGNFCLKQNTLMRFESDLEVVEMHFSLSGNYRGCRGIYADFEFGANQHNIFYSDGFAGDFEWSATSNIETFEIHLTPEFFDKYIPLDIQAFRNFSKKVQQKETAMLSPNNFRITSEMYFLIQSIISCTRKGKFKKMLIEAKVIELLLLQLEQISAGGTDQFYSIKRADVDKIHSVKDIILNSLNEQITLMDLAKEVGTNEFTLKKGFKEIFGQTVFGFWREAKMEEAKNLLLTGEFNIAEVSDAIGYKNPQHFSTAFKRKYGLSPREFRLRCA